MRETQTNPDKGFNGWGNLTVDAVELGMRLLVVEGSEYSHALIGMIMDVVAIQLPLARVRILHDPVHHCPVPGVMGVVDLRIMAPKCAVCEDEYFNAVVNTTMMSKES